ncbi:hypothetical protein RESH_02812 [Rhodopirellula europaea SH398]|uniref:Uncharacterized protein n=1 Tax=Rhodopirellula europaea SH398 TaxID=1263868 RepID=M5SFS1_9BACT|nr:hypothetical protein RESH_02812 [Rhodopirellula europaea SH398]
MFRIVRRNATICGATPPLKRGWRLLARFGDTFEVSGPKSMHLL